MNQQPSHVLDIELGPHDIQALSTADAVAAFFARLGYHTDARIQQTPGNLGIAAEGTVRPIKKIELLADQESLFQVYLFELTSVTVAHTRALARAFRNRAGNYLLVLTSDYEHLDVVLLEKYLPVGSTDGSNIGQKQVSVRPRVLTVERRKPSRIDLRVLRRLTWTESDPFAQYDKLLSAYAVADWSEEFFNNRALFSDYYLLERLRERPEWADDPKPSYMRLRRLYQGAPSRFAGKDRNDLLTELLEPVLRALGFDATPGKRSGKSVAEPDYRLYSPLDGSGRAQDSAVRERSILSTHGDARWTARTINGTTRALMKTRAPWWSASWRTEAYSSPRQRTKTKAQRRRAPGSCSAPGCPTDSLHLLSTFSLGTWTRSAKIWSSSITNPWGCANWDRSTKASDSAADLRGCSWRRTSCGTLVNCLT
ncbi:MAG: hypothetical protein HYZ81_12185 [Nitrospinae bacterium]|nr:hypothetical protein [Nitrospinota bacterium]